MINVFQPNLGPDELGAVGEVFASNWLGHGPRTKKFEAEFAEHLGVDPQQVIFLNSCTSGLFLATELLKLDAGDDVVLPSVSFIAAANAIAVTGARPVFCDVDPRTLNPTVEHVRRALTPRTKAVLVLHYGGYPGEIAEIAALCAERGIRLIEDSACSVASRVGDKRCGTFGDVAMWSFDAAKIVVTGDGGMLYVRDLALAKAARQIAYYGLETTSNMALAARRAHRWWDIHVETFGRKFIGNDVTAAIGSVQLRKLPQFMERRRAIRATYDRQLVGVEGIRLPPALPPGHETSHYFYWVQLDPKIRDQVAADLLAQKIYTTFRYAPLHKLPIYRAETELPGVDEGSECTLLLPIHQGLSDADVQTVIDALRKSVEARRPR